jgi:hypothetical protein
MPDLLKLHFLQELQSYFSAKEFEIQNDIEA